MSIDSSFDTPENFEAQSQKSPETLEQEIDEQRSNIGNIVDALEKKISPGQWVDQALAYVRENGGEFAGNLGNNVKANPVPAVLASVSILWLMLGSRTPSPGPSVIDNAGRKVSDIAGSVGDSLSSAKARIQETAARMKDKGSQVTDSLGEKFSSSSSHGTGDTLQEKRLRMQSSASTLLREQPMTVAAIGLAVGAIIGAALPASEREKQLIGQARDKLIKTPAQQNGQERFSSTGTGPTPGGSSLSDRHDGLGEPLPGTSSGTSPGLG
ncbi:DUF3618 domain-containing protein [Pseudomonas cichorii]|uniref:DUF3618 domain-containing protein n=1 Tax=Pseudomonas lijiangensis TaxID=2995658 RepID=A0ABX8HMZ0_9PSED|nr:MULTISPECIES: DUF3618 domain-containing protein [Pseudomonas syringae group]MBX8491386.1 DUF3618 domain-containing protein [Pseudomonas cichorii]MBX8499555.1 DUF3618 domain-containing protein [Pseudomonas lijiangensis]MBX8505325.1 DUF3618 domain-containing protein [Pseudomonas lijiangensis]MBX8508413.1 DUF3618 domain-containing protein [Pseudomonas cichorii]MBX8519814.1 DUF3618 domain-containing protein [Pseudomonas cichorii]